MNVLIIIYFAIGIQPAFSQIKLINTPSEKILKLDQEALNVLKKWDPEFVLFSQNDYPKTVLQLFDGADQELPMAVLADFDGDQKKDIALMGHNRRFEKVVILVSQNSTYQVVEVNHRPYTHPSKQSIQNEKQQRESGLSLYLSLLESHNLRFKNKLSQKNSPNALQLETFGGPTKAFYLKSIAKNKFEVKEYKGMINE